MRTIEIQRGDMVRATARNVHHDLLGAVTSGLVGTLTVTNRLGDEVFSAPITLHSNDDWYVDFAAPLTPGTYRITMVLLLAGAQRTLVAEMFVI